MSTDLGKEILELYNYLRKKNISSEGNYYDYDIKTSDRSKELSDLIGEPEQRPKHDMIKYGVITLRNKSLKIKHKYKIRHRVV